MPRHADIRWVFDELPPSGARRGGDPSEHAFRRDLESLVREVIQNANDQAISWPRVAFRLRELRGEALARYLDALRWDTLRPHLEGAAEARGGGSLGAFLTELEERGRLLVLDVEDRGTVGLTGAESEGDSHFRALCKDTLYSHKASESAGGSYGLGKSVLWTFSGISTVLFNSELMETRPGQVSPRLIGRAELPSHAAAERWYTGSGWFGRARKVDRGLRAESVWAEEAESRARTLHLARPREQPGTTIQIVGFRDPTREDETAEALGARIAGASVRYFWPAMASRRGLRVRVGDDEIDVDAHREVAPFVRCLRELDRAGTSLERPGDVARRTLPIDVPARRDGSPAVTGHVDLVVRLASDRERGDPRANHVAMFRGPGMVVRYWDRRGLTVGMRAFHAVLLAGEARHGRRATAEDRAIEQFLRAAEPPGHDEWRRTPALREAYKPGWGTSLERFHRRVTEALRELLAPRVTQGEKGPDRLQRRFPIGPRGSKGSAPSAFHFSRLSARFDGDRWHFAGAVEPVEKGRPWHAEIRLQELGDDGSPLEPIAVASIAVEREEGRAEVRDGRAQIAADATVRALAFRGVSGSLADRFDPPGELGFEVTGRLGGAR
ncbi:MAG TPA: hypothetical protein RMH99_29060 [Sandaracinaceae bacterium LLY-WYZ-13_1]|nr:hypothetical protein [Sandaracinaceae bacterium LLY-WYZ-13_1]